MNMDKNTTTKDTSAVKIDLEKELDTKITVEEPILKENPNRFVLFQYNTMIFGKCIKNKKLVFGLQKNWIYLLI
jgi:hypothetical protein